MRAASGGGVSNMQQTLTAEAAAVLKRAVAEAARRGHAQATPLHVAAALLSDQTSGLRRACVQAHPSQGTHLPHCRALELCFSIALERLQAAAAPPQTASQPPPSYSNALVAALKRAQAHQRRGGGGGGGGGAAAPPEQPHPQPPLLAVKVELDQLVISILDDPSVSRVMREAGFNSTDIKAHLEEESAAAASAAAHHHHHHGFDTTMVSGGVGLDYHHQHHRSAMQPTPHSSVLGGFHSIAPHHHHHHHHQHQINRITAYSPVAHTAAPPPSFVQTVAAAAAAQNSRPVLAAAAAQRVGLAPMVSASGAGGEEQWKKMVVEVMRRRKKRNPVVVMVEAEAAAEWGGGGRGGRSRCESVLKEMERAAAEGGGGGGGAAAKVVAAKMWKGRKSKEEMRREVAEVRREVAEEEARRGGGGGVVINLGDLEWMVAAEAAAAAEVAVAIEYAVKEIEGMVASGRIWIMGVASEETYVRIKHKVEEMWEVQPVIQLVSSLSSSSSIPITCCSDCFRSFQKEAHHLLLHHPSAATSAASAAAANLPSWLLNALPAAHPPPPPPAQLRHHHRRHPTSRLLLDLQLKWNHTCLSLLHQSNSQVCSSAAAATLLTLYPAATPPPPSAALPPPPPPPHSSAAASDRLAQDFCTREDFKPEHLWQPLPQRNLSDEQHQAAEDALGRLCKGLAKRISWQTEVISTIANTVVHCRSGQGKRRRVSFKRDAWLLFLGSDRSGKRQMAEALSELLFGEEKKPICISFGKDQRVESPMEWSLGGGGGGFGGAGFGAGAGAGAYGRGKMPIDQLAEAVRKEPSAVVLLEDFEQADTMFRSSLLHAMERSRLVDSLGRDVSFNNVVVVMTSSVGTREDMELHDYGYGYGQKKNQDMEPDGYGYGQKKQNQNKRKGTDDDDDDDEDDGPKTMTKTLKKPNLSLGLDLDLNISAEEHDSINHSCCSITFVSSPHHPNCLLRDCTIKPDINKEEILSAARRHLREFLDLVDAAVVFACSPL